jgi:hypothetical protein
MGCLRRERKDLVESWFATYINLYFAATLTVLGASVAVCHDKTGHDGDFPSA